MNLKTEASEPLADGIAIDSPYYVLIVWIVATSLSAVALLALQQFKSVYALVAGTLLSIGFITAFRIKVRVSIPQGAVALGLILLLASLFRVQPYLWVMGGQDQGIYVNMSEYYEKHGTPFVLDKVRAVLSKEAHLFYDTTQHYLESSQGYNLYPTVDVEGMKRRGEYNLHVKHNLIYAMHTAAVYLKDMSRSEYVFQFYPLHPLWMSISSTLLGSGNRVYSTVIFALLSIVSFYLLALELSGGRRSAGMMVAGLLACNPLHAFFSKFPVTEIPTLFFTSTGFYFLARYYKQSLLSVKRLDYLILSASLFFCMFFTRISGFMYMPVFYFILIAVIWGPKPDERSARHLILYSIVIMILYALTVIYGLYYSYPYSMYIYTNIFSLLFGSNWLKNTAISIIIAGAGVWLVHSLQNNATLNKYLNYQYLIRTLIYVFLLVLIVTLIRISINLYGGDIKQLFSYTLVAIVLYVCPFSFAFLYNSIKENVCSIKAFHAVLLVLFLTFIGQNLLYMVVPYQYYYARYLLSEIVPYGLLLVCLYWSTLWANGGMSKVLVKVAFGLTCTYFLFFSSFQLQGVEADGAAQALQVIKTNVKESEILLLGFDDLRLQTSLSYYYDINTYRVNKPQTINDIIYPELQRKYSKLYLLTKSSVNDQSLELVLEVKYREGEYEHANNIPMKFNYVNQCILYLYEIDKYRDAKSIYTMLENNKIFQSTL